MLFIKAYASGGAGARGTNTGNARGRRNETMSQFYQRTGRSAMGATNRTRGRLTNIRQVRGR